MDDCRITLRKLSTVKNLGSIKANTAHNAARTAPRTV